LTSRCSNMTSLWAPASGPCGGDAQDDPETCCLRSGTRASLQRGPPYCQSAGSSASPPSQFSTSHSTGDAIPVFPLTLARKALGGTIPSAMKFDGTNYQRWERKVHNVLARADLLHYALNGPRKYDQEAHAFVVGDRKAVALISDYLSDNILMELPSDLFAFLRSRETKTNSARLLDHIRDRYKETSGQARAHIQHSGRTQPR
jgi:hypothetical protein